MTIAGTGVDRYEADWLAARVDLGRRSAIRRRVVAAGGQAAAPGGELAGEGWTGAPGHDFEHS
jgi:hypothetical protein